MKRIVLFILSLVFLTVLISCEKTIEFKSGDIQPKIVVNAFFYAGNKYNYIRIEKSKSILEENLYYEALPNARVKLYEDGEFVTEMQFVSQMDTFTQLLEYGVVNTFPYENGYYLDSTTIIKSGSTYRLEVESEGFDLVSCETTVPYPPQLNSIDLEYENLGRNSGFYMPVKINCRLNFYEPKESRNYYQLFNDGMQGIDIENLNTYSYYTGEINTESTGSDTIAQVYRVFWYMDTKDPVLSGSSDVDIFNDVAYVDNLFSDELISTENYTLTYAVYADQAIKESIGEYIRVDASVKSISEEEYYYRKSLQEQLNVQDNPFAEPVPVFSNINGGLGIFGSSASSTISSVVGEYPTDGKIYIDSDEYYTGGYSY
ncbi:DUF4249 domain-containing protein [Maribellus sediminis]|uniref:DUF4249 domain-containing protein n=1 Tax=Maribellus sediminis TaxID=2696285 RepID=UPI0014302DE7|nr:DUF4249 domain-containing protein [Maribellus sediminis]